MCFGPIWPGFKSKLCHLLTLWLWAGILASELQQGLWLLCGPCECLWKRLGQEGNGNAGCYSYSSKNNWGSWLVLLWELSKSASLAITYHIFCLAILQLLNGSVGFVSWGGKKRPTIREGIYLVSPSKSLISWCSFSWELTGLCFLHSSWVRYSNSVWINCCPLRGAPWMK